MSETFFGSTKEFSSIALGDVSTVFIDPDNCELSPNPSMETLKFTLGKGFKLAALTKKKKDKNLKLVFRA